MADPGERLSLLRALALTVALAGIAVLIGGNGIEASVEKLPGIVCALAGAVCVALGTVLTKHFPLAMPPLSLAAWQIGLGCLPIAIVGLAVEQPQLAALSYVGWASMLYMTLIQFCLCYVCWFAALERLPAATASIGTLLVPVIGVLAAAAMLHEPLACAKSPRWCSRSAASRWRCARNLRKGGAWNAPPFKLTHRVIAPGRGAADRHCRDRFPTPDRRIGTAACSTRRHHRRPAGPPRPRRRRNIHTSRRSRTGRRNSRSSTATPISPTATPGQKPPPRWR